MADTRELPTGSRQNSNKSREEEEEGNKTANGLIVAAGGEDTASQKLLPSQLQQHLDATITSSSMSLESYSALDESSLRALVSHWTGL